MAEVIAPARFIELSSMLPVIDVRSESEHAHGHISGSFSIPLFSDEERAVVGTIYKNSGREAAVLKGFEFAGPKLTGFIKQLNRITNKKEVLVHCWRGGMRSESMGWLFQQAGYQVYILQDGYKGFRRYVREYFSQKLPIMILGGKTGSGKTTILHELQRHGEQVIDLEGLAHHKGSAFGGREDGYQPSNEQFSNELFAELLRLDLSRPVWIEDESRNIGRIIIPDEFFLQMSKAPAIIIDEPPESRIPRLVGDYSSASIDFLEVCLARISEKLGGTRTKMAHEALLQRDFETVASISLEYYDKAYAHSVSLRDEEKKTIISTMGKFPEQVAGELISLRKTILKDADIS